MKRKNLMMVLGLTLSVILVSNFPVYAKETAQNDNKQETSINSDIININDPKTIVSKVLTYDEIVEQISKNNNITKDEASKQVIDNFKSNAIESALKSDPTTEQSIVTPFSATYRTICIPFEVNSTYWPSLEFYCQTDEGGYFMAIEKILYVDMNRSYGVLSKGFQGAFYYNLEDAQTIYWRVNGDFFNNNVVTTSGGGSVGIKQAATLNFTVSSTSSHFAYVCKDGRYYCSN